MSRAARVPGAPSALSAPGVDLEPALAGAAVPGRECWASQAGVSGMAKVPRSMAADGMRPTANIARQLAAPAKAKSTR